MSVKWVMLHPLPVSLVGVILAKNNSLSLPEAFIQTRDPDIFHHNLRVAAYMAGTKIFLTFAAAFSLIFLHFPLYFRTISWLLVHVRGRNSSIPAI